MSEYFYKLFESITARRDIKASDKLVWAVIHHHIGNNSHAWPGVATLMKKTGLSRQTVIDSIKRLESAGLLSVDRSDGKSNHYQTSLKTRPVKKLDRSKKHTTGSLETRPKPVQKLDPNKKDSLNKSEITFPLDGDKRWTLPEQKLNEYRETYPSLKVEQELRKARQWLVDNPTKRKTAKGMPRFLNAWLNRTKPQETDTRPVVIPLDRDADGLTPRERLLLERGILA